MSEDITSILREWDEEPDSGKIRRLAGLDGRDKIQIRVQFGMLQMEADGRPDGKRPYGKESLLEHYLSLLETYKLDYGTDEGFRLDHHDCERLQDESVQYYQRYVTLFELEDYHRAERDTARNLRVIDLMKKYAERQDDTTSFEKYKPYIKMMNARAKAFIAMNNNDYAGASKHVSEAINSVTDFYRENEFDDEEIDNSQELAVLKAMLRDIRAKREGEVPDA
jgi:endo-1,4-beta-D-glucanase Y